MNAVMASGILELSVETQSTTEEIVSVTNNSLCKLMEQYINMTMVLAEFDIQSRQLKLANAGQHAYPMLIRNNEVRLLKAKGLALGIIPSILYKSLTVDIESGDLLLFMTDGITEPRNEQGRMYDESGRLRQFIASLSPDLSAQEIVDQIIDDVLSYMVDPEDRDDDITLVAVKVT